MNNSSIIGNELDSEYLSWILVMNTRTNVSEFGGDSISIHFFMRLLRYDRLPPMTEEERKEKRDKMKRFHTVKLEKMIGAKDVGGLLDLLIRKHGCVLRLVERFDIEPFPDFSAK